MARNNEVFEAALDAVNVGEEVRLFWLSPVNRYMERRVGRSHAMELWAVLFQRVDPVQDQHVQMHVEIERTAETLDEGDDAGAGTAAGGKPCAMRQVGLDGADDDGEAATEGIGPAGEEQAQRLGEAQHPLADGHLGEDVIDEMGRGLDHAPSAAGGAEPAAFAGERDEVLVAAAIALHAHEAVFESAAAQIVLELGEHKAWQ